MASQIEIEGLASQINSIMFIVAGIDKKVLIESLSEIRKQAKQYETIGFLDGIEYVKTLEKRQKELKRMIAFCEFVNVCIETN